MYLSVDLMPVKEESQDLNEIEEKDFMRYIMIS